MSWLTAALHRADPGTISAFAACAAAGVALLGATFQLFIGRRQANAALLAAQAALANAENAKLSAAAALINAKNAGRYKIAEFRQAWIHKVVDATCDHMSILMSMHSFTGPVTQEEKNLLSASRARLDILLNPDEEDTKAFAAALDAVYTHDAGATMDAVLGALRRLLKREWVRIKEELSHIPPSE